MNSKSNSKLKLKYNNDIIWIDDIKSKNNKIIKFSNLKNNLNNNHSKSNSKSLYLNKQVINCINKKIKILKK